MLKMRSECDENQSQCTSLLWESIAFTPAQSESIVVRVFMGGDGAIQIKHFVTALSRLKIDDKYKIEYINTEDVRKRFSEPSKFVDWLLGSHIHFILAHVHQGISQLNWCMIDLGDQLLRLHYHHGFPNGDSLKCPIFTQNKFRYITALEEFANPTLKINLEEIVDNFNVIKERIQRS
jgi:hypothetical protein